MGRMERTIFCFAMMATILIIVLVNVARIPDTGEISTAAAPAPHFTVRY